MPLDLLRSTAQPRFWTVEEQGDLIPVTGKQVLTFDCYGVLGDWETGILDRVRNRHHGKRGTVLSLAELAHQIGTVP